jgi:hypothetical protein
MNQKIIRFYNYKGKNKRNLKEINHLTLVHPPLHHPLHLHRHRTLIYEEIQNLRRKAKKIVIIITN